MSEALVQRLEAVAAKLESFVGSMGSGSAAAVVPASGSGAGAGAGPSARLQAYDAFMSASANPFLEAAGAVEGTKAVSDAARAGLNFVRSVLSAADSCKKPSDSGFAAFLKPQIDRLQAHSNPDNRSPVYNQLKSWAEGQAGALMWVQVNPTSMGMTPKQFVNEMTEAADFYLNKVLLDGKKSGDEKVTKFATTFKAMMQALAKFVQEHYTTGLEWNPKGGELSSFSAGGVPAAPAAPPAPAAPAPPAPGAPSFAPSASSSKPATSGMGAVFGELTSKGDGVTAGLRKVTADMKTKNIKAPALEAKPKAATASAAKPAAAAAVKREAKTYLNKGTWFVEYHEGAHDISLNETQIKENVYILKCKNATITLPSKVKSVQVDGCHRVNIVFKSVVSVFEIFNSQRVSIECEEQLPAVSVDKSAGTSIVLSRTAAANPPNIITSSITELNLVVPGKTDEDDPIEIPLPEQYETRFNPETGKITTEAVAHSAN